MVSRFVLRNVKMIDGLTADLVMAERKIVEIAPPSTGVGEHIIDFENQVYVSSGWTDMHVHAFSEFVPYGDEIDEIGYKQGVTTIIDAGSTGADRIDDLVHASKKGITQVYGFLNVSQIGLRRIDELSNLAWLDEEKLLDAVKRNRDFIVGLKVRMSKSVVGTNGIEPLKKARAFSNKTGLPLMVHIGSGPPDINEILNLLEKDDMITHFLHGKKNNLFGDSGRPLPSFLQAVKRGVHLDVGHGNASFSFHSAEKAKQHGITFDTISTDIYRENRINGPVYSLAHVLTKFLYLGYSLQEVINAVTVNPAKWLRKPELGRIKAGDFANLTLFSVDNEPTLLRDSDGEEREYDKRIVVQGVVTNGEYIKC